MRGRPGATWLAVLACLATSCGEPPPDDDPEIATETNVLELRRSNRGDEAASFSSAGPLGTDNAFHTPQGSNGRSCATCHVADDGWSLRPATARRWFEKTDGLHPLFRLVDANTPVADVSTVAARRRSYSMLLQGKFVRLRTLPATREYDVVAADDPFGFGTTSRLLFFRRPLPTANFRSHTVMWDSANTVPGDLFSGLVRQARGNVTGAQQGMPATDAVINAIVTFELSLAHAQVRVAGVGRLDVGGARGGPRAQAKQPLVAGRFDLFDAWIDDCDPDRRQIARGQELFNRVNPGAGRSCVSCHNAANNGQNVNGVLFDVGASHPSRRKPDMAVYTFRNRTTGALLETTDPGLGLVTGRWADLNRFKTPNLRGLAVRAPYFHNGIAATLGEVVLLYEQSMGFVYTDDERAALVAFMRAL